MLNENQDYLEKTLRDNQFQNASKQLRQTTEDCQRKIESAVSSASNMETLNKELIRLTNGCTFEMASPLIGEKIIQKTVDVNLYQLRAHAYPRRSFDKRVRECRQSFSRETQAMQKLNHLFKLKQSQFGPILEICKSSMENSVQEVSSIQ